MAIGQPHLHVDIEAAAAGEPGPRVVAHGEVDAATAAVLGEHIDQAWEQATPDGATISLDLSGVSFIDSSGLRVISAAHRRAGEAGGTLTVVAASDAVRRVFAMTGLDALLST